MVRTFLRFEEIEQELSLRAPKTVYKYRNWKEDNHKSLLSHQIAWFSHPFDLNDPLDVRPETVFDLDEINDPRYLEKMIASATHMNTERDRRVVAENKLQEIKDNPQILLDSREQFISKRGNFDRYGVFSTSLNELNNQIWEEYGDSHFGFSVGFNTIEMCRQMKSGFGYITYSDKPYVHHFLDKPNDELDILYLKKTKWSKEEEFRFITVGIGTYCERPQVFKPKTVSEIIFGYKMPLQHQQEILEIVHEQYPKDLPIFKIVKQSENVLAKERLR